MRSSMRVLIPVVLVLVTMPLLSAPALCDVPGQMNYQGFLCDEDAIPVNGDVNFQFYIYPDSTGGSSCWGPEYHIGVEVTEGYFELQLGKYIPINPDCFDFTVKWLEIWIGGAPLTPRKPISSAAYAFKADGVIHGSGTPQYIAMFTDTTAIGNSVIYESGGNIGIGTTNPSYDLDVIDDINAGDDLYVQDYLRVYGDARVYGNARVDGKLRVYGGTDMPPDYEHEETVPAGNCETWTHNLGGDPSDYIVVLDGRSSGTRYHQANFGTNLVKTVVEHWVGVEWYNLTSTQITVCRGDFDNDSSVPTNKQWDYVRIRIWMNQ